MSQLVSDQPTVNYTTSTHFIFQSITWMALKRENFVFAEWESQIKHLDKTSNTFFLDAGRIIQKMFMDMHPYNASIARPEAVDPEKQIWPTWFRYALQSADWRGIMSLYYAENWPKTVPDGHQHLRGWGINVDPYYTQLIRDYVFNHEHIYRIIEEARTPETARIELFRDLLSGEGINPQFTLPEHIDNKYNQQYGYLFFRLSEPILELCVNIKILAGELWDEIHNKNEPL